MSGLHLSWFADRNAQPGVQVGPTAVGGTQSLGSASAGVITELRNNAGSGVHLVVRRISLSMRGAASDFVFASTGVVATGGTPASQERTWMDRSETATIQGSVTTYSGVAPTPGATYAALDGTILKDTTGQVVIDMRWPPDAEGPELEEGDSVAINSQNGGPFVVAYEWQEIPIP